MNEQKRTQILVGILVTVAVVAAVYLTASGKSKDEKPPPSASGYYTGPMKNKSGKDEYSTEDNKLVPKPASAGSAVSVAPAGNKSTGSGTEDSP